MAEELGFGVVGLGMGKHHCRSVTEARGAKLVAVCDTDEERLAEMTELDEEIAAARFEADATVPSGGVRAETGAGRLRYNPREVLERICDEVRREASE